MITYKGHSISAEFAGIGKPPEFVVRTLSACGTVGMSLLGSFASEGDAKAAIDAAQPLTADTITDEQIRALRDATTGTDRVTAYTCDIALGRFRHGARMGSSRAEERQARARCAQILNARRSA